MEKLKNKKGFLMIRNEVFLDSDLRYPEIMVYLALIKFMNNVTKKCHPSIRTITKFSRISQETVSKSLYQLERKELIFIKRRTGVVNYYTILEPPDPIKKILTNSEERERENDVVRKEDTVVVGKGDEVVVGKEDEVQQEIKTTNYTKFNNTNIKNTNNNNTEKSLLAPHEIEILKNKIIQEDINLAMFLEGKIRERMPGFQKVDIRSWADDIRKMRIIDGRNPDQILGSILFSQEDDFWQAVILSAGKLRQHFDTLLAKYQRVGKKRADIQKTINSILG